MKQIVALLIALSVLLANTLLLSSCNDIIYDRGDSINNNENTIDDGKKECSHTYQISKTEADCTKGGNATYTCSLCGDTYEYYQSALGHVTNKGTCSRCGQAFEWEISYYVDEFNNPTSEAYIRTTGVLYGTFSNSATTDSKLYARILIDSKNTTIKLWEYCELQVKADTLVNINYNITILDDAGRKHYTTGTMYEGGERVYLSDNTLINLLKSNSQLKIYIQENSEYGVNSTYLFSVVCSNFESVYSDLKTK